MEKLENHMMNLEQWKDNTHDLKQGMNQELLIEKTRLI